MEQCNIHKPICFNLKNHLKNKWSKIVVSFDETKTALGKQKYGKINIDISVKIIESFDIIISSLKVFE